MAKAQSKRFWEVKNAANDVGEVYIYGDIVSYKWYDEDTTAASFKEDLDGLGDIATLNIYINSPGGSVFQGQAICSILKRHKAKKHVYIDGLAASIASVIAMAGDAIFMPANAMMMIHNAWTFGYGNAKDLRKLADDLDKINESIVAAYMQKVSISEHEVRELMDAESWLTAQECLDYGFCSELLEDKQVAASVNTDLLARYRNVPERLLSSAQKGEEALGQAERQALLAEAKANLERTKSILGGM